MNYEANKKKLAEADKALWDKYMDDKYICSTKEMKRIEEQLNRIPDMVLESDLETIFCRAEFRESAEEISAYFTQEFIVNESDPELKKTLQSIHDKALETAMIRRDF